MRILLIDDHALFREGVEALLLRLDTATVLLHAANFAAGLAIAEQDGALDVILLDLALPDRSGTMALVRLRSTRPDVPVVVVSATDDPKTVVDALDRGAMGFIPKSSTGQVLLQALRLVLAKGVYIPPAVRQETALRGMPQNAATADPAAAMARIRLTARQTEVLGCLVQGLPNKLIARSLGMEVSTVKFHVSEVLRLLKVMNRTQAVIVAAQLGLTFGPPTPRPPA